VVTKFSNLAYAEEFCFTVVYLVARVRVLMR